MRIFFSALLLLLSATLIYLLSTPHSLNGARTPRLGAFLSPQKGFWRQAEPVKQPLNLSIGDSSLQGPVEVYFDEKLVPHVYAQNQHDLYFVQGWLHAKFRGWQMEFQTRAAAGRLSEVMGEQMGPTNFLKIDRHFRRLGMVYAAEKAVEAMEEDVQTKATCDAYTAGVNAYLAKLRPEDYPLEYKLLDYKPEPWTNLKTALFLKYMSYDLAGRESDWEATAARQVFSRTQFEKLYPYAKDSISPIMPDLPPLGKGARLPKKPAGADSTYFHFDAEAGVADTLIKPDEFNGSNNWAVAGSKTASGHPILCNDPHLGLNFPSLWYEMQLQSPEGNAYGASFPGSPCIIIGFNERCAWGFTNGMRDVKDYYEVQFTDTSKSAYRFNGQDVPTTIRTEEIEVRGGRTINEKIVITHWGPVQFDKDWYPDTLHTGRYWATRWLAHDKSNELRTFYALNYSSNYDDYLEALKGFHCPAQNMLFACSDGDIALKHNGALPAKWLRQGDFIMPGGDSSYQWQFYLNDTQNQVMHNPARGFVSSANQYTYDPAGYPYYMGGGHAVERGIRINQWLAADSQITPQRMMDLQNDNYDYQAARLLPALMKKLAVRTLKGGEVVWLDSLRSWNLMMTANSQTATLYRMWIDSLRYEVYADEFALAPDKPLIMPGNTTVSLMLRTDSNYLFTDDVSTTQREGWAYCVTKAYEKAVAGMEKLDKKGRLWGYAKLSSVMHLLKIPALSYPEVFSNGSNSSVNAWQRQHGPSWKMIVHLNPGAVEAWGIYPGGQSGNPGSPFYDRYMNDYVGGRYTPLHFYTKEQARQQAQQGSIRFTKAA